MTSNRLRFLLAISIGLIWVPSLAQSELALYRFGQSVPQAGLLNPAFIPDYKVVIGFPLLSEYAFFDNDKLSFNDVFLRDENDLLVIDSVDLPSKLGETRRQRLDTKTQLLLYGFRIAGFYVTLGANVNTQTRFSYPGDLIGWAIRGPADTFYEGQDLELDKFSVDALAYHEYYAGIAKSILGKFSVGGRIRYIIGLGAARSEKIGGSLHVGTDSVSVHTSQIVMNTAGFSFFDQSDPDIKDYVNFGFKSGNKGAAIDLGATFKINNKITISAAVNDIGYIHWKGYTKRYEIDPVDYSFKGFDVIEYLNDPSGLDIEAEIDSLTDQFNSNEIEGESFTTPLVAKVYAGASFKLGKRHELGLVAFTDINRGALNPAVGLSYSLRLGRLLQLAVGGAYSNGRLDNVGAGLSLKLGPLHVYGVTDRANGFLYPARTSWVNARGGVNFVFGKVKQKEKDKEEAAADTTKTIEQDTVSVQKVAEPELEPEPEVVEPVDTTTAVVIAPPADTARAASPVVQAPVQPDTTRVIAQPVQERPMVVPEEDGVKLKRGNHPNELPAGHYVIVGVFKNESNAAEYSARLQAAKFYNTYGYVSGRQAYYVQVYYSKDDLNYVRQVRDQFRKMNRFEFSHAWVLSLE